ncbi:protein kinase domain-containing protein [Sorangium sp. So ce388]|uniref:protein kinase domain-containing protein n=1 Tax=Sorangium sp. So ce388 TaxID=3133309 RepID=UPI003F5B48C8
MAEHTSRIKPSLRIAMDVSAANEEDVRVKMVTPYLRSLGYWSSDLHFEVHPGARSYDRMDVCGFLDLQGVAEDISQRIYLFAGEIKWHVGRELTEDRHRSAVEQLARYVNELGERGQRPLECYLFVARLEDQSELSVYTFDGHMRTLDGPPSRYATLLSRLPSELVPLAARLDRIRDRIAEIRSRRRAPLPDDHENLKNLSNLKLDTYTSLRAEELREYMEQIQLTFPRLRMDLSSEGLPMALGVGSDAYVLRAWDDTLQRDVAVKWVRPSRRYDRKLASRIHRAHDTLRRLRYRLTGTAHLSQIIEPIGEFVENEFGAGYAMEYIDTGSLTDGIQYLSQLDGLTITKAIIDAMNACHACGILHRDLHPGNVLLRESTSNPAGYIPVMTDFDLLDDMQGDVNSLSAYDVSRIPNNHFSAPEVYSGLSAATVASEIYSLGRILWFAISGQRWLDPSAASRWFQRQGRLQFGDSAPLLREVILSMCESEASKRPPLAHCTQQLTKVMSRTRQRSGLPGRPTSGVVPSVYEEIEREIEGADVYIEPYTVESCNLFSYLLSSAVNVGRPLLACIGPEIATQTLSLLRRDMSNEVAVLDFASSEWCAQINILQEIDRLPKTLADFMRSKLGEYLELTRQQVDLVMAVYRIIHALDKKPATFLNVLDECLRIEQGRYLEELESAMGWDATIVQKQIRLLLGKVNSLFAKKKAMIALNGVGKVPTVDWLVERQRAILLVTSRPAQDTLSELVAFAAISRYVAAIERHGTKGAMFLASEVELDLSYVTGSFSQAVVLGRRAGGSAAGAGTEVVVKVNQSGVTLIGRDGEHRLECNDTRLLLPLMADGMFASSNRIFDLAHDKFCIRATDASARIARFCNNFIERADRMKHADRPVAPLRTTSGARRRFFSTSAASELEQIVRVLAAQPSFDGWDECMLTLGKLATRHARFDIAEQTCDIILGRADNHLAAQRKINGLITRGKSGQADAFGSARRMLLDYAHRVLALPEEARMSSVSQMNLAWYVYRLYFVHKRARIRLDEDCDRLVAAIESLVRPEQILDIHILRWCEALKVVHRRNHIVSIERLETAGWHLGSGWLLVGAGDALRDLGQKEQAIELYDKATSFDDTRAPATLRIFETRHISDRAAMDRDAVVRKIDDFVASPGFSHHRRRLMQLRELVLDDGMLASQLSDDHVEDIEAALMCAFEGSSAQFYEDDLVMYLSTALEDSHPKLPDRSNLSRLLVKLAPRFKSLDVEHEASSGMVVLRRIDGNAGE